MNKQPDPKCTKCYGRGHIGWNKTRQQYQPCPKCGLTEDVVELTKQRRALEEKGHWQ